MSDVTPDPTDTASDLAADLRALRLRAESPTLAKLQHDSGVSRSVLSSAFAGRQLPSARTIDRTVRALGEDSTPWIARRDAIAKRTGESEDAADETATLADAVTLSDAKISRRRARLLAGVAYALYSVAAGRAIDVGHDSTPVMGAMFGVRSTRSVPPGTGPSRPQPMSSWMPCTARQPR